MFCCWHDRFLAKVELIQWVLYFPLLKLFPVLVLIVVSTLTVIMKDQGKVAKRLNLITSQLRGHNENEIVSC